jgi:ABC-type transport system involved in multi-copper enzyme maturation permease subunit
MMLKFFSMLRDSFREAVDGWVIYVMVSASVLLILGAASVSFEPADAETAFQHIVDKMSRPGLGPPGMRVYANRGQSVVQDRFFCAGFVKDIRKLNNASSPQEGDYRFSLHFVDGQVVLDELKKMEIEQKAKKQQEKSPDKKDEEKKADKKKDEPKEKRDPADSDFRKAVAFWLHTPDPKNPDMPDPAKVTDDEMVAFIKDQFSIYGNMEVAQVSKLPTTEDGIYSFVVETKGMRGAKGWIHQPRLFFGALKIPAPDTLGSYLFLIEDSLVNGLGGTITLLVGVVITAFFIPNMMRKGAIDLLLCKPMARPLILIYKYIGGLSFVFLNTTIAVVGVWMVIGLRTGVWGARFPLTILGITFFFAILYAVSTLIAVLTRSAIVAILITCMFWVVMYIAGALYIGLDAIRNQKEVKGALQLPEWVYATSDFLHAVMPRTKDLGSLNTKLIVDDTLGTAEKREARLDIVTFPPWGEVIGVSMAWITIMLGLACWRFSTRDY